MSLEFKKSSKLNNVLYDVRGPVVEEERMKPYRNGLAYTKFFCCLKG